MLVTLKHKYRHACGQTKNFQILFLIRFTLYICKYIKKVNFVKIFTIEAHQKVIFQEKIKKTYRR